MKGKLKGFAGFFAILAILLAGCSNGLTAPEGVGQAEGGIAKSASSGSGPYTFAAMASLHVSNWGEFESQLTTAKNMGIDAISVDVWWGDVEKNGDQSFNWTYYDTIFGKIRNAGLDIVPIMSFHQCGGNVGDDYTSYVPSWIWNHFSGVSANDLKYRSETGAYNSEYVSLWADDYVVDEYVEFMNAFESRYGYMASDILEINISGGPAGELRYPSYNSHDWGGYPNRGTLQCYGELAKSDFREWVMDKYSYLGAVNSAWGSSLSSSSQINPPDDPNYFFNSYDYKNTQYGKDLLDWYNQSLSDHGTRMINATNTAFNGAFDDVEIGMKIPGIHWTMGDPNRPRLAEMTAGLIPSSVNFNSSSTGHGYENIVSTFDTSVRDVVLHFTCLEMGNDNYAPAYSKAEDLVFWVAAEAASQGIVIKGENALAGGVTTDYGWNKIENALEYAAYTGLTVLRLGNIVSGTGHSRYSACINQFKPAADTLKVHYAEFESASTYALHPWDGMSGDRTMSYEGYFNGAHWWLVQVNNAPNSFKFCFKNGNGNWDGTNRSYSSQGDEIYIKPYDSTVYLSRPW